MHYIIKKNMITVMAVIMFCLFVLISCGKESNSYGVFLGINGDEIETLEHYQTVVIEPAEFTGEQVEKLHAGGKTIYAYLNIGAIENYRPYYEDYKEFTLDVYEDWPDEQWMDVSQEGWQQFIIEDLGKKYSDMGYDGFFLDNADVYYHYPEENVYQGLQSILKGLKQYQVNLIINGGDTFVSRTIDDGIAKDLFDGVNQETVFTSINFDDRTYRKQSVKETAYFKAYLEKVRETDLRVYLLEYGADSRLAKEIENYCRENGFEWYNAPGLELTGD